MASELPDLSLCEQEPLHTPGFVQPHGVLFAMDPESTVILEVSASARAVLGLDPEQLPGQTLAAVLGQGIANSMHARRRRLGSQERGPSAFEWQPEAGGGCFTCYVHESGNRTILELEPSRDDFTQYAERMTEAIQAFQSIHQQVKLTDKAQLATTLIRQFTGYDRVLIYRFDEDLSGEVIAEALGPGLQPYLGLHYPASDIPAQARRLYLSNRHRIIVDIDADPSPLLSKHGKPGAVDLSLSILRGVPRTHREYMQNMGVRGTLVSSLVVDYRLWGLIACHDAKPKLASRFIRELFSWLCEDLSSQIEQGEYKQTQLYARQLQRNREQVLERFREHSTTDSLLGDNQQSDILDAVGAEGIALITEQDVITRGATPPIPGVEAIANFILNESDALEDGIFHTRQLSKHALWAGKYKQTAAGVLFMSLPGTPNLAFLWFRGERLREVRWAGDPDRPAYITDDGRINPRKSFETWKKTVRDQATSWLDAEIASAREFRQQITQELRHRRRIEFRLLQQSVSNLKDGVLITEHSTSDASRPRVLYVNKAFEQQTGYSDEEVTGKTPGILYGPGTDKDEVARIGSELQRREHAQGQLLQYRKDGSDYWVELDAVPVGDPSGWQTYWILIQRDISSRKLAENSLSESDQRYRQLLSQLNEGVMVVKQPGVIRSINESAARILGLPPDQRAEGRAITEILRLRDKHGRLLPEQEHPVMVNLIRNQPCRNRQHQILTAGGRTRWISINCNTLSSNSTSTPGSVLVSFREVTEELALQKKLSHITVTDSLTGLPNRIHFRELLIATLRQAQLDRRLVGVMIIDLDRFKDINDALNHGAGDRMLRKIASRVQESCQGRGTVARLGGDEFAIFTEPSVSLEPIKLLAYRISSTLRVPFYLEGMELRTSGSMGVTVYPTDGLNAGELLRQADMAMYAAKRENMGGVNFYSTHLGASVQNQLAEQARLRRALERQQFELHYQPKVGVMDGQVKGLEALIRWRDDDGQIIHPDSFIPLAESTGLIEPISTWVLDQAIRDLGMLDQIGFGHLSIAVNLSSRHFKKPHLIAEIRQLLEHQCIPPSHLEIEITETVLMEDDQRSIENLRQLSAMGVRVSIDDFGTGYSSLAYLRRFRVNTLKIDRSFVSGCTGNDDQRKITYAIVSMAHSMDLHTVAEGVETQDELALLQDLRCDEYQGYYYSRPQPLNQLLQARL